MCRWRGNPRVTTASAPRIAATCSAKRSAPPRWPDSTLTAYRPASSTQTSAGSLRLSSSSGGQPDRRSHGQKQDHGLKLPPDPPQQRAQGKVKKLRGRFQFIVGLRPETPVEKQLRIGSQPGRHTLSEGRSMPGKGDDCDAGHNRDQFPAESPDAETGAADSPPASWGRALRNRCV